MPVLVIEDDPDIREIVGDLLKDAGYSVTLASHGAEALEILQILTPRLILLDLSMPVMDGIEFQRHQLRHPDIASIPVVAMSAAARMEQHVRLSLNGALRKPMNLEVLLQLVERYCGSKHRMDP
jgi:CheY-like chemotaxis protein